jgi:predicted P-loop ATPase
MHSPKNNKPLNNEYNHLIYLTRHPDLKGRIQFDEFEQKIFITDTLPFTDKSRNFTVWTDADDVNLTAFLQMEGWPCNLNRLKACVEAAAREYKYHPVRSYLNGIEWDGESRTTNFLSRYFGCKPTDYVNAIGVRWMVSAVKRIFEPGCQSDYMLVLEGLQGKRKSTALRVLGGEWFTDEIPGNLSSKDAAESLQGVWIVEMSELHTLSKAEAEEAKQFISRRKDRFRGAFKRRTEDFPRQCIFAGTTNQDVYMKDETGARRFWPFKCVDIKLDELIRDRDQIWAECVQLYRAGHSVYLETDVLEDLARSEQSGRLSLTLGTILYTTL